ncbi:DUF433 domain-containing protein [Edaphobacter dinghuensis]|uniref:DUF433 domain-containing protein n=1 Tax=Edaphobacter dinghuensis TaxID=1560005 RepID=A0A917MA61_9BACT|nr:DUF433 domain-containing protein [Edaphobacter dinghuensis]GGG87323.1 hypothetical protein GCM10011585_34240 [Edaphobacter dinghuensis]
MDPLEEAREMVIEDPGILSGTPVIKGTRVPVHDVAGMFDAGVPMDEILESYPSLKKRQVELASVYARAFPAPKRPRRHLVDLEHVTIIKRERLSLSALTSKSRKTTS